MNDEKTKPAEDEAARLPLDPRSGGNGDLRTSDGIDNPAEDPLEDRDDAAGHPGFGDDRVTPHLNDGR